MTLPVESPARLDSTAGFERQVAPALGDLYRQARRLTDQHADAEDLVQETLAKAFAGFDSFRPDSNIHAWLYRILLNTHISHCRKTKRRPTHDLAQHITDVQLMKNAAHSAWGLPSAEEQALKGFGDQDVRAAMRALPEQFRTTVYYADIEGLRCKEIAAVMNAPIGTVVSRLHRGRRRLRLLLAEARRCAGYAASQDLARTA
ncbi:sigma-70 family RNA polymerase sigma factor [Mycobacterium sp. 852002-51057_SCH5723018]|uniref:sigma-70 family RNA polymerase sigma factor n=1 Tax=Mycobacterium sp. 852002-51057_SCH5723018 TaxID=1834094 RepID=UPI0008020EE8|nr:sigma-70 family RNA polymerase sigma factor [Mycobacterium sp. 852002-51057_SCH5723018]OBG28559.1 RNA polymerase subunit sigma-24 [Mycobacterium sp. 852002-51057_SCH5723018]